MTNQEVRSVPRSMSWRATAKAASRWALVVVLVIGSGLFVSGSIPQADSWDGPQTQSTEPVPVTEVEAAPVDLDEAGLGDDGRAWKQSGVEWPEPGTETVSLSSTAAAAGDLPITLAGSDGDVTATVVDQRTTRERGVSGVLIELSSDVDAEAEMTVDYADYADAYGGGWASRLRIVALPNCHEQSCDQSVRLDTVNDADKKTVTARVSVNGSYAVVAAASGESGDYTATDLQAAGSWSAGGSAGGFSYSYPLRTPPAAGPVPALGFNYSSQSHDGRTSGSNNQASWVGDGWTYEPGYVERTYKACSLDQEGNNNNSEKTGDQCWDGDSDAITLSLDGTNTALVKDDTTGEWRAASDANWKIEKLGSPATSSTATSERWKVTTTDGTQYFFAGDPTTSKSRWTVPVFGNHSGEACRASAFENSMCQQAWRWAVDKVVDVHGNQVVYTYVTETGHYGSAGDEDNRTSYIRSGHLTQIDYGLRSDDDTVTSTGRVFFTVADRCLSDCGTSGAPKESNWPDTPWDLTCDSAPCTDQHSPSFFSSKRLTAVTTQVADGAEFRDVDSWALEHEFKDYGDDSQVVLWLKSIQHTGHVGEEITLPKTSFAGQAMPNRVETENGIPAVWRWRISAVTTETGGVIGVNYSEADCGKGDLPSAEQTNSRLCYPVYWTPEFYAEAEKDWFHKYVVTSIVEQETTAGMDPVTTYYEYSTSGGGVSALWAWDDGEFTDDDHRTYSQWRGYSRVTTKTGDPTKGPQLTSRTQYYRGMNDQPLPNGDKRSVELTDSEGNKVVDHRALSGVALEVSTMNGTDIETASVTKYWTKRTASRSHDGGRLEAWLTGPSEQISRQRLTDTAWQSTRTLTTYDDYGRAVEVNELGDVTVDSDDLCTRTEYADNTDEWILNAVARSETVSVACTETPDRPGDLVSDTRTYFDGSTTFGAAPTKGLPTRSEVIDSWSDTADYQVVAINEFDALGRQVSSTDALNRTMTTVYMPSGSGPVTQTVVTNPLGHELTSDMEPAWGTVVATIDANDRRTDMTFDALGRSLAVWLPGQSMANDAPAHYRFGYEVSNTQPTAITSERLTANSTYVTSVSLFDSLLRPIQTQSDTPRGGRLITETDYNTAGQVVYTSGPNYDDSATPGSTFVRVEAGADHSRTIMAYDALGRTVNEAFWSKNVHRWDTAYEYGGSTDGFLSTVIPPDGGVKTAVLTNARGQEVQKRQYHDGGHDTTDYTFTPRGDLASVVDSVGNTWSYEYDLRGNLVASSDPDTGVSTAAYDPAGQKIATTDARGVTVSMVFDELGRTVETWEGETGTGTLLAEYGFDTVAVGIGLPATTTSYVDGDVAVSTRIGKYNPAGQPTQLYTSIAPIDGLESLADEYLMTQTYKPDGSPASMSLPGVGGLTEESVVSTYTDTGEQLKVIGSMYGGGGSTIYVDAVEYSPFGEMEQRTIGSGTKQIFENFNYEDGTRRTSAYYLSRSGTDSRIAALHYEYDDAGNVLSIADEGGAGGAAEQQCFQYDGLRQLSEAWTQAGIDDCAVEPSTEVMGGPAPYWSSFEHDVTGNRTSEVSHLSSGESVDKQYRYPGAGEPGAHTVSEVTTGDGSETYDYDESGNLTERQLFTKTETLSWNALGKVDAIAGPDGTTRMIYDAEGNRVARIDGSGDATVFAAQTEITHTAATGSVSAVRSYAHNGDVVATRSSIDGVMLLGSDHHGTAVWAVAVATMAVTVRRKDPYGNARGGTVDWGAGQKGFVGGVEDPTGLVHIGARSYDPSLGKFISADPVRDFTDPQQINGYTYANANPVTMSDPTGLMRYDPVTGEGVGVPTKGGGKRTSTGGNQCVPGVTAAACADFGGPNVNPIGITLESGGEVVIYPDGTLVIDGYVIPEGHPDTYAFIDAYDQAASNFGYIGDDFIADSIRLAMIACDLLGGSFNTCSYEFNLILEYDYDAWELGGLLPSYLDGEPTFYSDGDGEWSAADYAMWAKMLGATGIEKRAYQKALAASGHTSKPEGLDDLPWNPMDPVVGCIVGGLGIGTIVSIAVEAGAQKSNGGRVQITKTHVKMAGLSGCISGAIMY